MEKFTGKIICEGIAIGKILFYAGLRECIERRITDDTDSELSKYHKAKLTAAAQLEQLYIETQNAVGDNNAQIFRMQKLFLEDEEYDSYVQNIISARHVNAEYAIMAAKDHFYELFTRIEDGYINARSADVKDVSERLIHILLNSNQKPVIKEPVIVVADDLTPSDTVKMDKANLLAFVTRAGAANSHVGILTKAMGIPALSGVIPTREMNGKLGIVDANEGIFILEPDEKTLKKYKKLAKAQEKTQNEYKKLIGKKTITQDGREIKLYANISSVDEAEDAVCNDAGGIGLFRSEFLYLERDVFPTEEEQFCAYKKVAEEFEGKEVVIRTFDIGADKKIPSMQLEQEQNPAMGYRAIRISLNEPELFKTQLRAIYRASAYGTIRILYPMITSVSEVLQIKELVEKVKAELRSDEIMFGDVKQGIMIETPAAVMISDLLAKEVDFFSIGTNDLTQYTLAIDRSNAKLDNFYDAHHEAIMRMIKLVVDNGHSRGIEVGICGELAADVQLTEKFLKMGVDELSVSPMSILPIRKIIREC